MARVAFARLCRDIKKSQHSDRYSLVGSFVHMEWAQGPFGFVCVVYWERANETFRQSFALVDEAGHILDDPPSTECVLTQHGENISTAFFYASFPEAGNYNIKVYQNAVCIKTIPLQITEASQTNNGRFAPHVSAAQS